MIWWLLGHAIHLVDNASYKVFFTAKYFALHILTVNKLNNLLVVQTWTRLLRLYFDLIWLWAWGWLSFTHVPFFLLFRLNLFLLSSPSPCVLKNIINSKYTGFDFILHLLIWMRTERHWLDQRRLLAFSRLRATSEAININRIRWRYVTVFSPRFDRPIINYGNLSLPKLIDIVFLYVLFLHTVKLTDLLLRVGLLLLATWTVLEHFDWD